MKLIPAVSQRPLLVTSISLSSPPADGGRRIFIQYLATFATAAAAAVAQATPGRYYSSFSQPAGASQTLMRATTDRSAWGRISEQGETVAFSPDFCSVARHQPAVPVNFPCLITFI